MKFKRIIFFLLIFFSITLFVQTIEARPGGGQSFSYDNDNSDDDDYSNDTKDNYSNNNDDDNSYADENDFWNDDDDNYSSNGKTSSIAAKIFWVGIGILFLFAALFRLLIEINKKAKKARINYRNKLIKTKNNVKTTAIKPEAQNNSKIAVTKPEPKANYGFKYLYELDENFSKVFFVDFVNLLAVRYYSNFGKNNFKNIEPYISDKLKFYAEDFAKKHNITNSEEVKINEVVVGAINFNKVIIYEDHTELSVDLEINFTLNNQDKRSRHLISERWSFERKNSVKTKEPKTGVYEISCPNCGASLNFTDQKICTSCGEKISNGKYDWNISTHKTKYYSILKQNDMFYYANEKGTSKKTIVDYQFKENFQKFIEKHNLTEQFKTNFKENIVKPVFLEMYHAWSELKWEKIRHLLSDRMWESNNFWIKAYKHYNVVNKLDKIFINEIEFAKIETDKFFETITVRIWASCIDYVKEIGTGKFIAGDNKNYSVFSEYWTFVRRTATKKPATEISINTCPNCGAPADKIGQSAICKYCNTKISTGEFGWILSAITQDNVYGG